MKYKGTSKRIRERLELRLPVRVHCRESADFEWIEVTRLIDVTPFGAGFSLKHPTEKGRLLHMTIPMPRQLRVFDHVEDQYRIWGLVRHVRQVLPLNAQGPSFEVGVAFVGKRAPASYETDPTNRYDIAGSVSEAMASGEVDKIVSPLSIDSRTHTRFNIAVDMLLEILNEKGEADKTEQTATEEISKSGATVFTSYKVPVGRFIRLTSQQYKTTAFAAVRKQSVGADGIQRIHVEFIGSEWPL